MSPRRTRRGTIKQDNATPDTTKREKKKITSPKETSHSPPKRRRTTRAAKTKSTSDTEENRPKSVSKKSTRKKPIKSDDSLITEDESFSTINNVSLRNTTKRKNNSLLTDDESPKNSSRIVNLRTRMNTTPKSSPIAVTLSPHRSKKTPRRSPDNLGSPKTHSADTPMKLLKTPRKLVIKNSPSSSSSSDDLKLNAKRRVASKSPSSRSKPKTPSPTITSTSSVAKKKLSTPKKTTPSPKKQSPIAKKSTRRNTRRSLAPMSAKKVIISPRLSSMAKKSPSPKKKSPTKLISSPKKLSSPRTMASPKKSLSPLKKQTPSPKKNSPIGKKSPKIITRRSLVSPREEKVTSPQNKTISSVSKKKSPRLAKLSLPVSKIRKSPIKAYSSSKSKVPVVILEKVNSSTRRSEGSSPKSQKSPVKLSPRRSNSIVNTTSTVSPKNLNNSVKKIIFESPSTRRSSKDSRLHLSPKVTLRRSLNLTGCFDESISVLRKKSSTPKYKSNRNRSGIENESEPDMSDTSLINMSDVFDSDVSQKEEKEKNKNGTYELDEPKTPGLRAKKAVKRSSSANAKGNEVESKKVRFAESNVTKTTTTTNTVKLRTGTPGHRASLRRTSEVRSKSKSPQRVTKSMSANQRRRSSSVSVVEGTPRTPANKKTLNSTHSSNVKSDHKAQLASVNRLSRPRMSFASEKKTETKTPVPKKIPNFAEIHKKTFAKMESVVDAKKRVADRHVAMVNPILSATKSMPVGANEKRLELRLHNGVYNRFGFKMRKTEAVETISKKPISMTSEKKLNARRDILKGVRTNRRFELQMKSRKSFGSK